MELHEEGRFRAKAIEGDYGYAGTGTEQVAVLFQLEDGARLTWFGYLTENSQERTLEALMHCGVKNLETLEGLGSQDVEVVIQHDEYNDTVRAKIAFVNALGSGGVALKTKMTDGQRKGVAARLKGNFLKMQRERGMEKSDTNPAPPPLGDDDIPF